MMWVDYAIDQAGPNFTVKGDWPGEVMGWAEDGTDKKKTTYFIDQEMYLWSMKVVG